VQQLAEDEFVAVLSDHDSGAEVCAWSGAADGIVVAFEAWLDKKYPVHRTTRNARTSAVHWTAARSSLARVMARRLLAVEEHMHEEGRSLKHVLEGQEYVLTHGH
jgi:hypothetical protein